MPEIRCIYCNKGESDGIKLSKSDIIPDSLTNAKITCSNVCSEEHNSKFGNTFESEVINNLAFLRNKLNIKSKRGKFPEYTCEIEIDGTTFIKNKLSSDSNPIGKSILRSKDGTTLLKAINDLDDVENYEKIYDSKSLIINKKTNIDLQIFNSESMFRMVSKIAYEWFCKINNIMYRNSSFLDIINFITTGKSDKTIVVPIMENNIITQMEKLINTGSHFVAYYITDKKELKAIVSIFGVALYKINVSDKLVDLDFLYEIAIQEFDLVKTHDPVVYKSINDLKSDCENNFILMNIEQKYTIPVCISDIDNKKRDEILLTSLVYKYFNMEEHSYCEKSFYDYVKQRIDYILSNLFINKPEIKRFSKEYGGSNFRYVNWENPDADFWLRFYICYLIGKSSYSCIDDNSFNEIISNNLDIDNLRLTEELAKECKSKIIQDDRYLEIILEGLKKIDNWK